MAGVHDADPVSNALNLVELMTGKKNGSPLAGAFFNQNAEQRVKHDGVETNGRLVKNQ